MTTSPSFPLPAHIIPWADVAEGFKVLDNGMIRTVRVARLRKADGWPELVTVLYQGSVEYRCYAPSSLAVVVVGEVKSGTEEKREAA